MPALLPTAFYGEITWLGAVPDRDAALASTALDEMVLTFAGFGGEAHGGLTRPSCSRVTAQYPRETEIRNTRQLSVISAEDLTKIAAGMGVAALHPGLLGASMVIAGIPDFTRLPPGSRLQAEGGATLVVDMENRPCNLPAKPIDAEGPGNGRAFKAAAKNLRGVTAWVEREGVLHLGERIRLHVPDQPAWPHLAAAREA
jgi:MOSC domain